MRQKAKLSYWRESLFLVDLAEKKQLMKRA